MSKQHHLLQRAQLLAKIRAYFANEHVTEVEVPTLAPTTLPASYIESIHVPIDGSDYYLQTSPEFFMKRLLAQGMSDIYYCGKAYRLGEIGRRHQMEFTLLEWYRVGYTAPQLIDDVECLLASLLPVKKALRITYQQAFLRYAELDPLTISLADLKAALGQYPSVSESFLSNASHDACLDWLMSEVIELQLPKDQPVFITHYPASQAALAKLNEDDPRVADRFELYYQGMELANGFAELTCSKTQRARFEHENQLRVADGKSKLAIDEAFIEAVGQLPQCAGVALGVDRLAMIALGVDTISEVVAFAKT